MYKKDTIDGETEAVHILTNTVDGNGHDLTVSASHGVVRVDDGFNKQVVQANQIKSGDSLKVATTDEQSNIVKVLSVTKTTMPSRTVLYTKHGTVVANGILTATSCGVGDDLTIAEYHSKRDKEEDEMTCIKDTLAAGTQSLGTGQGKNKFNEVGIPDIFEAVINHCSGASVVNRMKKDLRNAEHLPAALQEDPSALLELLYRNDGLSKAESIQINPYLCDKCDGVIDINAPPAPSSDANSGSVVKLVRGMKME